MGVVTDSVKVFLFSLGDKQKKKKDSWQRKETYIHSQVKIPLCLFSIFIFTLVCQDSATKLLKLDVKIPLL